MILKLTLDLPEDGDYIRITRMLGRTLLTELHVVEPDIDDLELLIGELCTNVVRHAHTTSGRFRVVQEFLAERVVLTVEDTGKGFAFHDVPEPGTERPDTIGGGERIGGFGMSLVRALADRLQFARSDPQGTTVHAEVELHYRTPEDHDKARKMDAAAGAEVTATTS